MSRTVSPGRRGLLRALGLHRRDLRAWALYDWANSAFVTSVGVAILPIYFASVAGVDLPGNQATAYWGYVNSLALLIIAIASPVLGAMADFMGAKKRFLGLFMGMGVLATAGLYFVERGDWQLAALLYIVGTIGMTASIAFADSLLPHIASEGEVDQVSTAGYALGYVGGGILLLVHAAMISRPQLFGLADAGVAVRVAFVTVALWWLIFSIPLFRRVSEPPRRLEEDESIGANPVRIGLRRLRETFGEVRQYRDLFVFLVAYWFFIDGIHSIPKLATIYGASLGIGNSALLGGIIVSQFVGIPFTFAFGSLAGRIGAIRGIYVGLVGYTVIAVLAMFVSTGWHFYVLAAGVGVLQGGTQALSRSVYATMVPKVKSSEFFSFYSIFGKFAGIVGPTLFALVVTITSTARLAILSLAIFFIIGMVILSRVDLAKGQRTAREEDASARAIVT
ncbi:MAG: MFS transporter [Actinomycetota bacterium]|nr:MFS transporter [Actinomycetota bacterium]HZY65699.1 MFS transporter [Rubrobacteraceae bacterium]